MHVPEDGFVSHSNFGPATPLVEYRQILTDESERQVLIKQEPDEQSYFIQAPTGERALFARGSFLLRLWSPDHHIHNTPFAPQHPEAGLQFSQPHPAQQTYNVHSVDYALPPTQPGFIVQHQQAVPYTFEPIHFDRYYQNTQRQPAQAQPVLPYSDVSSKSQPAMAVMSSAEYQHVGVSEAELAEMWAMLDDDNAQVGQQQNIPVHARLMTTGGPGQIDEDSMEGYSKLPGEKIAFASIYKLTISLI